MTQVEVAEKALSAIIQEYDRATRKFGEFHGPHEGYAVILEELDELWDQIKGEQRPRKMKQEAMQVAAMALRFLVDVCGECFEGE